MSDPVMLQVRYEEVARELDALGKTAGPQERAELRRRIVALYQEVDAAAARLEEMRGAVQRLGERFREGLADSGLPAAAGGPGIDGSPQDDEEAMRRAEELDVSTYLDRAWNCLATCRYDDALLEVTRALERVPGSTPAQTLRGWALMRLGRLEEARAALQEVLRVRGESPLALASLGYVAYREGRDAEAIEHLSRASRSSGDRKAVLYAHLYMGMLYTRREMFRDGRSFLERALELGPSLVEAYWEMGRSYYLEGQFTQALDTWRRGAGVNRFDPWGERCQEAVERARSGAPVLLE